MADRQAFRPILTRPQFFGALSSPETGKGNGGSSQPRRRRRIRLLPPRDHLFHLRAHARGALGAGLLRAARLKGRLRVVLEAELDRLRDLVARDLGQQRESEVDAGGDAAAREAVAVAHHPLGHRNGAERLQQVARGPVAGRLIALQQARGAQHQRAGAH